MILLEGPPKAGFGVSGFVSDVALGGARPWTIVPSASAATGNIEQDIHVWNMAFGGVEELSMKDGF